MLVPFECDLGKIKSSLKVLILHGIKFSNVDIEALTEIKQNHMNTRPDETKILFNVLTGEIKVLSVNSRFEYLNISKTGTSRDRIKYMIGLLKIIRKLKSSQTIIADAQKKIIEAQIYSQRARM